MKLPSRLTLVWLLLGFGLLAACSGSSDDVVAIKINAAAGGSVVSNDGLLTLAVPPGALAEDTQISIHAVASHDLPDDVAAGAEGEVAYRLEPDGLTFTKAVEATLHLDLKELSSPDEGGAFEVPLLFLESEGADPELLTNLDFALSLEEGAASISGELEHFSWIRRGVGPVFVNLEQPDDAKPLGLPFKVNFSYRVSVVELRFDECKDCKRTSSVRLLPIGLPLYQLTVVQESQLTAAWASPRHRLARRVLVTATSRSSFV